MDEESESVDSGRVAPWRPTILQAEIDDLRARLRRWRRSTFVPEPPWAEGIDPEYLAHLVDHWIDDYDVDEGMAESLRHPWFELDAQPSTSIRFIHARAERLPAAPAPMPLLLCHGWPDSAWRYLDVIDRLTDPVAHGADASEAFDVVVPDMPGFGFSPPVPGAAIDSIQVAHLFADVMRRLGYDRFAVAGGDIGSSVARFVALDHPSEVIAVHRMDAGIPVFTGDPATLAAEERDWLAAAASWGASEGAYAAMHRTKPATIAAALSDSPAGLAAWVVEKFESWTDSRLGVTGGIPIDSILTLLTTTWLMNSIGPSMRMYRANAAISPDQHARRVEVPSGFSIFPADLLTPPRAWLDRIATVTRLSMPEQGGHFAPREVPEIYAGELRDFFRPYR
jgi:pimeloyl-ACP methyl ester carboxylesterase